MSKNLALFNTALKAELKIDKKLVDTENAKVSFILSDETKVTRYSWSEGFYMLQLLHGEENIDLSRAEILKLFYQHDTHGDRPPIGRFENVRVEDGKLKGDAIFDKEDEFAMAIFGKIERGFLESVSVGVTVLDGYMKEFENKPSEYTATLWQLNEVSVVNIPAIPNAKVGLSQETKLQGDEKMTVELLQEKHPEIAESLRQEGRSIGLAEGEKLGAERERERILAIEALSSAGYEHIIAECLADASVTADMAKVKLFDAMQAKKTELFEQHKEDGKQLGAELSELSGGSSEGGEQTKLDDEKAALLAMQEAGKKVRGEA
jgi:HK97 family phage prohead protease